MANIFVRVTDIISANINEMIDRMEDPERMIKQIIREMEDNIRMAREGVLDAMTSEKQLAKELKHHREQSEEWKQKAESALRSDNEEMARKALTRKKEHDKIIKNLETSWESARNTCDNLKSQLRSLENKLDEAKRKRTMLAARQKSAEARQAMGTTIRYFERGVNAEEKFGRMEDRVSEIEARAEAVSELYDEKTELDKEFEDFEKEVGVDSELEELKKKLNK